MKFQVGDRVLVLHSDEEGEVVDIINNKMVMVDVRGVRFPAYIDQLDFPYFRRFTQKKPAGKPQEKPRMHIEDLPRERQQKEQKEEKPETGVWLSFIPVAYTDEFGDEVVDELKIHLVNQTKAAYRFEYRLSYARREGFTLANEIGPFGDFYIHDIPFENVNDGPVFHVVFSLTRPDKKKADFFEGSLRLKPKQVFARVEEARKKGEAMFSYKLMDRYPEKMPEEKLELNPLSGKGYKIYSASSARQHLEQPKHELDLHIEKLTADPDALDSFEKLTLQVSTLEKYLDLAVAHHLPSMIVIHGVGTGRLRDEVHEALRLRRDVKSFVNRYHPAYGYGATEVFFKY